MTTQSHIFYSGTVHGVGFRYTVERCAVILKLTGWVRNLSDGRVEILLEGPQEDIEKLLHQVDAHFEGYIKDKEISLSSYEGKFNNFVIVQ